jgi:acetyltransferase-like isoleucine patch superfamily enzyme
MASKLAYLFRKVRHFVNRQLAEASFAQKYPDAKVAEGVLLYGLDRITAGRNLFIDRRAYLNCGTLNGSNGFIHMGDDVEVGPYSVLWGAGGITIGNNVHIGAHVSMTAHEALQMTPDREYPNGQLDFDYAPIVIEDHVLICSGTTIVPGVRIGHHSMIGGGAVVTSDIPPYSLAVGCPARVIKTQFPRAATNAIAELDIAAT